MKLLHIDSSILGDSSASQAVTREIVAQWEAALPGLEVTHLDLGVSPISHLSGAALAKADELEAARDTRTLADFQAANVLVIGAPMYNFAIPTQLKAWIDRVVVAGQTFRYTEKGPEGLAVGKRAIVVVSRGGVYPQGSPADHVESYLQLVLNFVGVTDITFVRAEGLAISPEHRQRGMSAALAAIPAPIALAA